MLKPALESDVLIVGGGLVGSVLAHALGEIPVRVTLVEMHDRQRLEQPSFDGRATALANGSQRVLEQLGLWSAMRSEAQAIRFIHIGEQGRFGAVRIEASEEGVEALGYTVENRILGEIFWSGLQESERFTCLAPARLVRFSTDAEGVSADIEAGCEIVPVRARLLIAADGSRSSVRESLGIAAQWDDYGQHAVIANCTTALPHAGRAFERFTPNGPLALLPLTRGRVAVVWTMSAQGAAEVVELDDSGFADALQRAFGQRLGRIERVGERAAHPLGRVRSKELTGARTVLIGNAAVSLHPVAGQGFNLALRDVATIAEIVADEVLDNGMQADVGAAAALERYHAWRVRDQKKVAWFTHGLVKGFGAAWPGLGLVRGLGMVAFDLVPGAKSMLARHTMGMAGRLPRLARRLRLS